MLSEKDNGKTEDRPLQQPGRPRGRARSVFLFIFFLLMGAASGIFVDRGGLKHFDYQAVLKTFGIDRSAGMAQSAVGHEGHEGHEAASSKPAGSGDRRILYYVDPMNPSMKSDKPGKAPCGMDLVPIYEDEAEGSEQLPPGTIKLSAHKQQLIGIQYSEATEQNLAKTLRTIGRITYDETKIAHVHTKYSGWIDKVFVDFTGKLVKKGQPLVSIYSPELVSTQQELLIARLSKDYLKDTPFPEFGKQSHSLYSSTRQRLKLWDVTDAQINEIEKRGEPIKSLILHSAINGYVLERKAFSGMQATPEMELYSIADLSSVWVLADIYEYEVPFIKEGQTAVMTLSSYPGRVFQGKVTYINPELDPMTRTLKVRIELANPNLHLKPDMYANVELKVDYGKKLVVPQNAVLDSGSSQTVFVARDGGYFEPRQVVLGQSVGEQAIILEGLKPGEKIVASANFLIDSESQLKSAVGGMGAGPHAGHGGGAGGPEKDTSGSSTEPKAPEPGSTEDHSRHGQS